MESRVEIIRRGYGEKSGNTENMPFFEDNIKALEAREFPAKGLVLNVLVRVEAAGCGETARAGCPTLYVEAGDGRIALHSARDPVREAEKWVRTYNLENARGAILAGFALGYAADAVLRFFPQLEFLMVIEPNLAHFAAAMHCRDLRAVLSDPRLVLFMGPFEWVESALAGRIDEIRDRMGGDNVAVLVHAPSLRAMPKSETRFRDILRFMSNMRRASGGVFDVQKQANAEANAEAVGASAGVSRLFGRFAGVPVFVVCPGPSLEKNVGLLKIAAGSGITVALDAALRPLQRRGLAPDFVLTLDPQPIVSRYFTGEPAPQTHLVFFPGSNPDVVAGFPAARRFHAASVLEKDVSGDEEPDALFASGSVFLAALDFAARLGGDPLILAGSDLAIRPNRSHARGSPAEMLSFHNRRECQGCFGVTALTTETFFLYLRNAENYIEKFLAGRGVWNATEGGAHIAGARPVSMREALFRVGPFSRADLSGL